jgi:hypothetical protein
VTTIQGSSALEPIYLTFCHFLHKFLGNTYSVFVSQTNLVNITVLNVKLALLSLMCSESSKHRSAVTFSNSPWERQFFFFLVLKITRCSSPASLTIWIFFNLHAVYFVGCKNQIFFSNLDEFCVSKGDDKNVVSFRLMNVFNCDSAE